VATIATAGTGRLSRPNQENEMLNVWRLQLLRELSRRGSIKAAAEAMSVTPSAVSQQLAILEKEAGVGLLEKSGRGVRLTDAAMLLVRHADSITGAIAAAEADLAGLQSQVTGTLRIAAFPTAARAIMPPVMTALSHRHPSLRVTLRDLEAAEALTALQMDEIDVALVDEYDEPARIRPAGLEFCEFLTDPLFLALPPGGARGPHSIARGGNSNAAAPPAGPPGRAEAVRLADLRDSFWIMDTEDSHLCQVTLRACRASGFEPHVRSNCKDFSVIIALVEAGLGVGMLPGLAIHDRAVRASIHPTDPPLARRLLSVIRPERSRHPMIVSALAELERFGAAYPPVPGSGDNVPVRPVTELLA
jgi:DNA-binding transcriptional LysR family regulator